MNDICTIGSISSYISSACSISLWIYIPASFSGLFGLIATNRNLSDFVTTFNIAFDDRNVVRPWNTTGKTNNRAFVISSGGGTNDNTIWKTDMFTNDKFYHITHTVSAASGVSLYINGLLISNIPFVGSFQNPNVSVRIANQYGSMNDYPLRGNVSDVKIYNKVLSAAEVLQNYNATRSRFNL